MFLMAMVAASTSKALFSFTDRAGRAATVGVWVDAGETDPGAGGVADLRTNMRACSDAAIKNVEVLAYATESEEVAPDTDAFDRPTDKLGVELIDLIGATTKIALPSLKSALYQSDGTTPLTTGPAAALLAAIVENCCSADGVEFSVVKRAQRFVPKGLVSWNKK